MSQRERVIRGRAVSAVALLVLAAFAGSEVLAIVGGVAVLAWFALAVLRQSRTVRGGLDESGDWLQLWSVHSRFVDALDRQYEQAGVSH